MGDDGLPVQIGPEILSAGEWEAVLAELDSRSRPGAVRSRRGSAPLYGVVFCSCGSRMLGGRNRRGERRYQCARTFRVGGVSPTPDCGNVLAEPVEEYATKHFLTLFGPRRVVEYVPVPGQSYAAEIRELRASLDRLDAAFRAGAFDGDAESYASMRRGLRSKIDELGARPTSPPRVEVRDLGVTYGMMWETEGVDGRRELMRSLRFRVIVGPRTRRGRVSREEILARLSWEIDEDALLDPESFDEPDND